MMVDYWGIKRWLWERKLRVSDIAKIAEVCRPQVSMTIKGERRGGWAALKVLAVLKRLGCPAEYLEASGQAGAEVSPPDPPLEKGGDEQEKEHRRDACATGEGSS